MEQNELHLIPTAGQLLQRQIAQRTLMPRLCLPTDARTAARQIWHAMKAEVEARYCQFESSEQLEANILDAASLLTSADDRRFGIMAAGYPGTGKTMFANALRTVINSYDLVEDPMANYPRRYRVSRHSAKSLWKRGMKDPDSLNEIASSTILYVDDLGEDAKEAVTYGNVLTPMIDLFEHRYERRLFTIATTNLTPADLCSKYDERVASRFSEMMLVLTFTGKDHRITNFKTKQDGE